MKWFFNTDLVFSYNKEGNRKIAGIITIFQKRLLFEDI